MSIVDRSLREPACPADNPNHLNSVPLHCWELHVGTVQLFIVGPGADAWLKCSESCYSGQIGTGRERAIALCAVRILNRTRLADRDAGPAEIREVLAAVTIAYDRAHPAETLPAALAS